MKVILSNHAKKRLFERGIKMNQVLEIIEMPDYVVSKRDKKEAHKKINGKCGDENRV